jgi:hypothetical protein
MESKLSIFMLQATAFDRQGSSLFEGTQSGEEFTDLRSEVDP